MIVVAYLISVALYVRLCAVLSQFSAATADTEAGVGNLSALAWEPLTGRRRCSVVGLVAAALSRTR